MFCSSVVLVSFCVKSPISFESIKEKWIPQVRRHCPNIPMLLVGLQCDLRGQEVDGCGYTEVPREDALQLAKDIGEEFITLTVRTVTVTATVKPVYC